VSFARQRSGDLAKTQHFVNDFDQAIPLYRRRAKKPQENIPICAPASLLASPWSRVKLLNRWYCSQDADGIDIGAEEIFVAVPPDRDEESTRRVFSL
jgi:hypothetical protein